MSDYYRDENGKVVLRYFQPIPKLVKVQGRAVYFDAQHGISLAFVDDDIVPPLLAYLGGCCGGQRQVIFLATETQYSHWKDGNGGR